jgi:hypothetical protein
MSVRRLAVSCVVAGSAAFAWFGCGGDSSGPSRSVTGVAGDSQTGPTAGQLPFPLSFVVLDGSGVPASGVSVTWSVTPAGAATFSPLTSTTDGAGSASTVVTLGIQEGPIVIRGAVGGAAPVTFNATVVHPCDFFNAYTFGTSRGGTLATTDCNLGGWYYDLYGPVTTAAQQGWTVSVTAAFNTWVEIFSPSKDILASNGSGTTGSSVQIIVGPGQYIFGPNSLSQGVTGPYTLSSVVRAQTLAGCNAIYITRGVTISDNIVANECTDSSAAGVFYGETAGIFAVGGSVLTIAQRSTAFDPYISLFEVSGGSLVPVAANDDSASGNPTAFLQYTVPQSGLFVIFATTSAERTTGAYTLSVAASAIAQPTPGAAGERLRPAPSRLNATWVRPRH